MEHPNDHNFKTYSCTICQKVLRDKAALTFHMNAHTGEKPYACELCEKKYGDKRNLRMHVRTVHEGFKRTAKRKN